MKRLLVSLCFTIVALHANKIYATFDVIADKKANIAFRSTGTVEHIFVDIGSNVHTGDTLAKLNNDEITALVNIAKVTRKYAKLDLDRQNKVKHIIDQIKYNSYAYKYAVAIAQLKYQQILLDKTILKAPFDGVIISKEIEVGDVVSGQAIKTAFVIQNKNKRKLILKFDQKYNTKVNIGDLFSYKIDGDTIVRRGKITKIYPYSDSKTRKIKAEVETSNIVVGLFGDGYITTKN